MKKIISLLFLLVVGVSAYAQVLETSSSTNLGYLKADDGEGQFYSEDGVLFLKYSPSSTGERQYCYLVKYPASKTNTSYTIPTGTYRICRGAFEGNKYLQVLNMPNSIKYVGDNAFDGCSALKEINYGSGSSSAVKGVTIDEKEQSSGAKEVGRYNIQGVKLEEGEDGQVQIILYSDGTTKKVIE